jgi:peroxiredoxin (alkyl hydroperoxide reductase subunit C)
MSVAVRSPAPEFRCLALARGELRELALADFRGRWLVLLFHPLDVAFAYPTELIAFGDRAGEFRALGAEVLAASVDSAYTHLVWWQMPRDDGGLDGIELPLVADLTRQVARDYGVLLEAEGAALRGLFVIDPGGIVRHLTIDELSIGRSVDDALRALRAAQRVGRA